ncbi:hypothetical protein H0H92_013571 [Tricholoma furcatifolium]|nr:hypothetical protein H0H92_013571 [Tricholoma furcatifolium]
MSDRPLGDDLKKSDSLIDVERPEAYDLSHVIPTRPPLDYSSPSEFAKNGLKGWGNMVLRDGWKYGLKGWGNMVLRDGWKYFILASFDVEGNFLVVKGVFICVAGLGLLVTSDELTDKDWTALSRAKGDAFMIAGATLYGLSNSTEEFFVRRRPLYEVVGQMGMWGTLINGIQAAGLEHEAMKLASWNKMTTMFILYTVAPMLYRLASSTYYNLSLLSSDFWGLLFAEEQGTLNPTAPSYVNVRGAEAADAVPQSPILA